MRRRLPLAIVALALLAAACGEDDGDISQSGTTVAGDPTTTADQPTGGGAGDEVTVVGEDIAFDVTSLEATVGETLTITFENRDEGTSHNLHVMGTAEGDSKTEIEEGPVTQTLEVTFDEAGEFEYLCDVHPTEMTGTITVSE